jgi:hypothetical protein
MRQFRPAKMLHSPQYVTHEILLTRLSSFFGFSNFPPAAASLLFTHGAAGIDRRFCRASLTQIDAEQLFTAVGSRPAPPMYVMKPRARLLARDAHQGEPNVR